MIAFLLRLRDPHNAAVLDSSLTSCRPLTSLTIAAALIVPFSMMNEDLRAPWQSSRAEGHMPGHPAGLRWRCDLRIHHAPSSGSLSAAHHPPNHPHRHRREPQRTSSPEVAIYEMSRKSIFYSSAADRSITSRATGSDIENPKPTSSGVLTALV